MRWPLLVTYLSGEGWSRIYKKGKNLKQKDVESIMERSIAGLTNESLNQT